GRWVAYLTVALVATPSHWRCTSTMLGYAGLSGSRRVSQRKLLAHQSVLDLRSRRRNSNDPRSHRVPRHQANPKHQQQQLRFGVRPWESARQRQRQRQQHRSLAFEFFAITRALQQRRACHPRGNSRKLSSYPATSAFSPSPWTRPVVEVARGCKYQNGCITTMMKAKADLHTSNGKRSSAESSRGRPAAAGQEQRQPAHDGSPSGRSRTDISGTKGTPNKIPSGTQQAADLTAGTRVRLRDSGRLGTVVGKKAGGWWIVDVTNSWSTAVAGLGGAETGAISSAGANGTVRASSSSSGPITTRRVNMEPLGNAYAAPSPSAAAVGKETGVISSPALAATEAGVETTVEGTLPSVLRGNTISLDTLSATATANETAAVAKDMGSMAINDMSRDGLAHADMEEWLVFSDLHVGPGSLDVGLEVLDRVNEEAMKRPACGVAFLGDFWHSRGSLKASKISSAQT
ncbi:unnamed protein product, partial [Sphacelaria rigidula]